MFLKVYADGGDDCLDVTRGVRIINLDNVLYITSNEDERAIIKFTTGEILKTSNSFYELDNILS